MAVSKKKQVEKEEEKPETKEVTFQYRGYAFDHTYPKWFQEAGSLFSPTASVLQYSTHCDIYVPGTDEVLRAELGDYISRDAKGKVKVIKKLNYRQEQA